MTSRRGSSVALVVLIGLLAGCGATAKPSARETTARETTTAATSTQAPLKPPRHPRPVEGGGGNPAAPPTPRPSAIRRRLQLGNVAFNAPSSLQRGQSAEIELLVSRSVKAGTLAKKLSEPGLREAHSRVLVSNRMAADLTGAGFDIVPETNKVQPLGVLPVTTWRWQVAPTRTGTLTLHLTLSALIAVDGEADTVALQTFQKNLHVQVSWGTRVSTFFSDNWKWLATTIVIPLFLWFMRQRRRQRERETPPAAPEA
jgi:hypothetical protein